MKDDRAKVLAKIKALLSKTIENGCTEAEAMSALNMASAMMDAYEVTEEDLSVKEDKASIGETDRSDPHNIRSCLAVVIGDFVDCKVWRKSNKVIVFCGLKSDVDFGMWLLETLAAFVKKELTWYLMGSQVTKDNKRLHINGFVIGCCNRIVDRLRELINASKQQSTHNRNALVVIKSDLIAKTMKDMGINLRTPRQRGSRITHDSYNAGKSAGDRASFGRPVSGTGATLRIK